MHRLAIEDIEFPGAAAGVQRRLAEPSRDPAMVRAVTGGLAMEPGQHLRQQVTQRYLTEQGQIGDMRTEDELKPYRRRHARLAALYHRSHPVPSGQGQS